MDQSLSKVLAIIPARLGSKRIPKKNIRLFHGKPLITYAIEQALATPWIDRVVVDTESEEIAAIARAAGADVPFLRPPELAQDTSKIIDSLVNVVTRLRTEQDYHPTHVLILQTTSPLREPEDLERCWQMMQEGDATTVLTVCPTHPRLYHLGPRNELQLVNGSEQMSTNMQAWPPGYLLNGCFVYIVKTEAMLEEHSVITKKTRAVICDKWRSVDLDTPEEWVMAEVMYAERERIKQRLAEL